MAKVRGGGESTASAQACLAAIELVSETDGGVHRLGWRYSAAKAAVIRLVESLAAELKDEGITVNCVLPGTIDTPENRAERPNADFSKWVSPEQMARVFLFLCSDAARAITGAAIPVYGRS